MISWKTFPPLVVLKYVQSTKKAMKDRKDLLISF